MEQLANNRLKLEFAIYSEQQVGLRGLVVTFNTGQCCDMLYQRLTQLTQFDERGVRVACKGPFG
tara:strand:+ start:8831 stop:9022 length:192 start_codon:yes stop_codon:yes gene_type:complete